jgi:predicted ATP-grasp superfamily ATP-dependent carboligase
MKQIRNRYKNPAVVLGLGAGGLDAVRSLGKQGIEVYGIFTENKEAGRISRYCKALAFPSVESDEKAFLEKLLDLAKNMREQSVLLAVSDRYITFMSKRRRILLEYFFSLIRDGDSVEKLVNKEDADTSKSYRNM